MSSITNVASDESHGTATWKKRSVVSSFIFDFGHGASDSPGEIDGSSSTKRPRVALFRRSGKVSTYQHHLAPISGSIGAADASPLAAAWRELAEETTLTGAELVLLRQGKSYTFRDESVRREWTVFPFAFRLRTPADEARIVTDWEHETWGWHNPAVVIRLAERGAGPAESGDDVNGVPRLADSLRRVWFEADLGDAAGRVLATGLDALATDHQSGARQLATAALRTLRDVVASLDYSPASPMADPAWWWAQVRMAAWHLWKNGRESMGAAIMSALLAALAEIGDAMHSQQEQQHQSRFVISTAWRDSVVAQLDRRVAARAESAQRVSAAFVQYLEGAFGDKLASREPLAVLTLSESSTIRAGLRHAAHAAGFALDVRVLESRPLFEGVSLASALAQDLAATTTTTTTAAVAAAHTITLFSDASAALAAQGVDVVVIGADRIASSGAVSNKTGSLPAVLSVKYVNAGSGGSFSGQEGGARVVVLGETDKIAVPGRPEEHVVEDNDASQLSRSWAVEDNSARVRDAATALQSLRTDSSTGSRGPKVSIRNVFFEWVPAGLIDVHITESGQWSVQDISKHSEKLRDEEGRLLSGL
ncbi:hypothetical protein B0T26DRAFT_654528 [Lasiosphaeria miniovina]|uniref:Nudix hydrolase domain-containing protein n=1 Tax=Lasiosphaeria miniovina TaxID=1954250 RepID=A0AA40DNJ9_9PEZI|nr:uncharacterized protein B0T26DRAFT_654528 [Lasiosphaeria miniovina]KAK0710284.1 hypothetical protein B0T26DRAFT_654528 [Lasiosphaeria miniovina]